MPDLAGTRVLVTGASGFLGANLVSALLHQGAEVTALHLRPEPYRLAEVAGDIRLRRVDIVADPERLHSVFAEAKPAIVFHLAAYGASPGQQGDIPTITRTIGAGTSNVFDAALGCDLFVHCGGSSEYGPHPEPLNEDIDPRPVTVYGRMKAAATRHVLEGAVREGRPVTVLRPFSIYGPWEAPGRLIPTAIRAALNGHRLPLTAPGYRRDLIYVADVADALIVAAHTPAALGEIINVGTGVQTANEEVVAAIERVTGRGIATDIGAYQRRRSDTEHWVADTTKAERLLGWKARYDLEAGLTETVEHLKAHAGHPAITG